MRKEKTLQVVKGEHYDMVLERSWFDDGVHVDCWFAYTHGNEYIGSKERAEFLIVKLGIAPEKRSPAHKVCSIGFSQKEQKWYGWSHRARWGFGIGDVADPGDCGVDDHENPNLCVPAGFVCKTLDDCKRRAMAFAESVG